MQLLPRKDKFFELLNDLSDQVVGGAERFQALVDNFENAEAGSKEVKDFEHAGDRLVREISELLHKTFIAPFDREDIRALTANLDTVLDWIDAAAQRIWLFEMRAMPTAVRELTVVTVESARKVKEAVSMLSDLKHAEEILKLSREINRLEDDSDNLFRRALAQLFREENDLKQLLKLKEIYECLEKAVDACEDCADVLEGLILEYA